MVTQKDVILSFSCPANWDSMKPDQEGRFCTTCQKSVVDFREKQGADLRNILLKKGSVCGGFYADQIPSAKKNFRFSIKLIIASALLVFGCETLPDEGTVNTERNLIPAPETEEETEMILGEVTEIRPAYKFGGEAGLQEFLKLNLHYPQASVNGLVIIKFVVSESGEIANPEIIKGLNSETDQEVLRIVGLLQFEPALRFGLPIRTFYYLPVTFRL